MDCQLKGTIFCRGSSFVPNSCCEQLTYGCEGVISKAIWESVRKKHAEWLKLKRY